MPESTPVPPVFVHVDLDGLWTLAGVYGFDEKDMFGDDPVFKIALERMMDLFARRGLCAGVFIVGRDLEHDAKRAGITAAIAAGHEPANHSHGHRIGLERLGPEEIREDIARAQRAIVSACGISPVGFRAPGYDAGPKVLSACVDLGLRYDGSSLSTPWGPVLRFAANRLRTRVAGALEQRPNLADFAGQYGSGGLPGSGEPRWFPNAEAPSRILRLPLAVSRRLGLPLHASIGSLLGEQRMLAGWSTLLQSGTPRTFLLHGLDFLDPPEFAHRLPRVLGASRAFQIPLALKRGLIERTLDVIQAKGRPMLACDFVRNLG